MSQQRSIKSFFSCENASPNARSMSPAKKKAKVEQKSDLDPSILEFSLKYPGALDKNIGPSWFQCLAPEFEKPYFKDLSDFVSSERASSSKTIFPPPRQVWSWTHDFEVKKTKVVIIGQDPYHGEGQAHGLCFSVQPGVEVPPSLKNIFKELETDIEGFKNPGK